MTLRDHHSQGCREVRCREVRFRRNALANKTKTWSLGQVGDSQGEAVGAAATLNEGQRRAVEHGAHEGPMAGPLLIIAGAGSGKTSTLAHRVSHLIAAGADPRRILLLTFS